MAVIKHCVRFCHFAGTTFHSAQNRIKSESELIESNCPRLFAAVEMMFIFLLQRDSDAYAVPHSIVRSTLWYDTVTN